MKPTQTLRAIVVVALGTIAVVAPTDVGAVDSGRRDSVALEPGLATFEGRTIDLQKSWGDAEACHVAEDLTVTCYRSEAAMDAAHGLVAKTGDDYPSAANGYASCGSYLRLYKNTYYNTPALYLSTRRLVDDPVVVRVRQLGVELQDRWLLRHLPIRQLRGWQHLSGPVLGLVGACDHGLRLGQRPVERADLLSRGARRRSTFSSGHRAKSRAGQGVLVGPGAAADREFRHSL